MSESPKIPSIPPPAGHSAFGNDDTLWKWNVLCVSVCLSCATIPFLFRTYVRAFIKREWLFEDYMSCFAWAGLGSYCGLMTTVMIRHGGVHQWDLTANEVHSALYWFNITSIEYGITILICKLTILMIYRPVFVTQRWDSFDIMLRIFEFTLISFYFSITVVKIFECTPRTRIWNRKLPGTCININTMLSTSGMFNFTTDVLLLLVPIKSVWKLQMKKTNKVRVVLIFTFGMIAPVFSLVGFLVRERISHSPDGTYNQPLVLLWGSAEVTTGFICICLPPLSIFFHRRKPKKGPTQSILNGDSNKFGSGGYQAKRKAAAASASGLGDDDLLAANYIELNDGSTYTIGVERPMPTHVVGIVGGVENGGGWPQSFPTSPTGEHNEQARGQNIVRTIRIEQSFK